MKPSWRRAPQRVWLRRAIFQIHLWVGIALTLYAIVIGLSGSALVFREEIDHLTSGVEFHAGGSSVLFDRAIRQIVAQRPGWRAAGLEDIDQSDKPPLLLMQPAKGPRAADYRMVAFDPGSARILSERTRYEGVMGWITNLHYYLLAGPTGLLVSGYMALALLILCISGVVLWWPGVRRWAAALVLRRRSSWRRLNWDIHSVTGFWCAAALAIVSFTGVYFAFPAPVAKLMAWTTGGPANPPVAAEKSASLNTKLSLLDIDTAIQAARSALPKDAPPSYIQLPSPQDAVYRVTGYHAHTAPYSQLAQVTIDGRTGAVLHRSDTRQSPLGARIIQYFFTVHFGSFGGPGVVGIVFKLLWVLLGIMPALLGITGVLMYWNRKLRPLWISFKAMRAAAAPEIAKMIS